MYFYNHYPHYKKKPKPNYERDPEQDQKVAQLSQLVPNLPQKDQSFAKDLVSKGLKITLSPNQMVWVNKLIDSVLAPELPLETVDVGSFQGLLALFAVAKQNLKFPKLHLEVDGNPVTVSVAGPNSKAPGTVNVVGAGRYPDRKWYGRVSPDGVWYPSRSKYAEQNSVEKLLKALAANPAQAAHDFGKLTGNCCFCRKALSDEHSTAAGFGPVCAKNWGLLSQWKQAVGVLSAAALAEIQDELEFNPEDEEALLADYETDQ